MTAPTIPPQQPEPEQVCGNCEFFRSGSASYGKCNVWHQLPPCVELVRMDSYTVNSRYVCVLFRARKES